MAFWHVLDGVLAFSTQQSDDFTAFFGWKHIQPISIHVTTRSHINNNRIN